MVIESAVAIIFFMLSISNHPNCPNQPNSCCSVFASSVYPHKFAMSTIVMQFVYFRADKQYKFIVNHFTMLTLHPFLWEKSLFLLLCWYFCTYSASLCCVICRFSPHKCIHQNCQFLKICVKFSMNFVLSPFFPLFFCRVLRRFFLHICIYFV